MFTTWTGNVPGSTLVFAVFSLLAPEGAWVWFVTMEDVQDCFR